ncbi:MAG: PQQ-binding-like beta-propeller repeat protein [Planctomycetaceae bacterium]
MNARPLFALAVAVTVSCCLAKPVEAQRSGRTAKASARTAENVGSTATDWSSFRGPDHQGAAASKNLPLTWSTSENIAWKVALPGPGASSPIVFGDHIYLTCYSGFFVPGEEGGSQENLKRHLVCLDRASGKSVWEKVVPARLPEEERIRDHGFAANTPAADSEMVICFFGKTGVFAFDHSGKQLWTADVGSKTHGWGTAASPVIYGDLVFINASVESESLYALDRKTGREVWKARGIKEAWNTPVVVQNVDGKPELIVATQGSIQSFDPKSGKQLWTCATDITWYMVPSVVAHEGIVYCLGGRSGVASLAVRTGGSGDVTSTHRLWTSFKGSNVTSPVLLDGNLYWMNDNQQIAFCADAKTGELHYEQRMNRAGQVYASALLAGDRVYYLTREGKTFVVAAKPEFQQLAVNDLKDGSLFNGSMAVDGDRLLIRSDKFLYAVQQD